MRIKSFKTSKYKNLHNIDIKFDADVITLLVGQNGLGKSNMIEILTLIFRDLYTIKEKKNFIESAIKSELSDYIIEYECNGIQLKIDYHDDRLEIYLKETEGVYQAISFAEFARNSGLFLPKRIMGYYSGENKRLEKILNEYTSKEKKQQLAAYKKGTVSNRLRNIFFSENRHSQLILFTLIFYWNHPIFGEAINHLLNNILDLDDMTGFNIKFKSPKFAKLNNLKKRHATLQDYEGEILSTNDYNKFTDTPIFWGIKGPIDPLLRLFLFEYLGTNSCTIYEDNNQEYFVIHEEFLSYDTFIENIYRVFPEPLDFFDALEAASSIGALDDLKLNISKSGDEDFYSFTELSEGEQQLISVLGLMTILRNDQEEVLYLIDEPDTHINPLWQRNFVRLLLENIGNYQHRHMFISTHSPFLVQAYDKNVVDILLFRKDGGDVIIDVADNTIKNWRIDQVLMSPYFGLKSTRPSNIDEFMDKRRAIIERGEFTPKDKEELSELENELGFLPTGETLTELESMVYIHNAANRFKQEDKE